MAIDTLATIGFKADTSGLTTADKKLKGLETTGKKTESAIAKSNKSMSQSFASTKASVSALYAGLGALAALAASSKLVQYADEWKNVNSQLRQVTDSEESLVSVRERLLDLSRDTRSELTNTVDLYAQLTRSTKDLGVTSSEVMDITKTLNNLFVAGGKPISEVSGAIRQLSQGFAAGALRGDEFNSVAEGAPKVMDALGKALNMTRGELREFAATGGITAEIMVNALKDYSEEAQKMADQTEKTFGQSMTNSSTNLVEWVGSLDKANSAINATGEGIESLTGNLMGFTDELGVWSDQFGVIAGDFDKSVKIMSSGFDTLQGEFTETSMHVKAYYMFLGDAISLFPSNVRAMVQILTVELASVVDIGLAGGKAFADAIGVQLGLMVDVGRVRAVEFAKVMSAEFSLLVDKAVIYGKQIADAMNPFDGDSFDFSEAISEVESASKLITSSLSSDADDQVLAYERAARSITNKSFETAEAKIIASRAARIAVIGDVLAERDESIKAYDEAIAKINEMKGAIADVSSPEKSVGVLSESVLSLSEISEKAAERIENAFADAWLNMFDGFDSVVDGIKNAFKRLLAEMAHMALTKPIMISMGLGSLLPSTANAGGLGGAASGLLGGAFGTGMAETGTLLSMGGMTGLTSSLSNIGGLFSSGSYMAAAGAAMPLIAGAVVAAMGIDKLTGGKLFGSGWERESQSLNLSVSGGSFSGETSITDVKQRSLFRGRKWRTETEQIAGDAITEIFEATNQSILSAAESFDISTVDKTITEYIGGNANDYNDWVFEVLTKTISTPVDEFINNFNSRTSIDIEGMDEAEIQQAMSDWVSKTTDAMINAVFGDIVSEFNQEGETNTQTLDRLMMSMSAVNTITDALGLSFELSGTEAARASMNIIDLAGGLDNLNQLTTQYYQGFYSEAERAALLSDQLGESFAELGREMPTTREGFRAIVDSLDLTKESAQAAFASLMQLVPSMNEYISYLDTQTVYIEENSQLLRDRARLEIRLAEAVGNSAEALEMRRELELSSTDKSLHALLKQIYAAQDATTAASELAQAQEAARQSAIDAISAEIELNQARQDSANSAITAANQLIDAARSIMDDANNLARSSQGLVQRAVNAEREQYQSLHSDRLNALTTEHDAAMAALDAESQAARSAHSAQIQSLNIQKSAAQDSVNAARDLSNILKNNSIVGGMSYGTAQQSLMQMIAGAESGSLPTADEVSSVIAGLEQGRTFGSSTEKSFEQAVNAARLKELGVFSDKQLSVEERMLAGIENQIAYSEINNESHLASLESQRELLQLQYNEAVEANDEWLAMQEEGLDSILDNAEGQLNALLGIDDRVLSVADALSEFNANINNAMIAQQEYEKTNTEQQAVIAKQNELLEKMATELEEMKHAQTSIAKNTATSANVATRTELDGQDVRVVTS